MNIDGQVNNNNNNNEHLATLSIDDQFIPLNDHDHNNEIHSMDSNNIRVVCMGNEAPAALALALGSIDSSVVVVIE